jgi:hypothetical protein
VILPLALKTTRKRLGNLWPVIAQHFPTSPYILQEDNVPCHVSRRTNQWKTENDIPTLEWPPTKPRLKYNRKCVESYKNKSSTTNRWHFCPSSRLSLCFFQTFLTIMYKSYTVVCHEWVRKMADVISTFVCCWNLDPTSTTLYKKFIWLPSKAFTSCFKS